MLSDRTPRSFGMPDDVHPQLSRARASHELLLYVFRNIRGPGVFEAKTLCAPATGVHRIYARGVARPAVQKERVTP